MGAELVEDWGESEVWWWHRGNIGCRRKRVWVRSRGFVVVRGGKDGFRMEMRVRRVMGLRVGKSTNAFNLRIHPLSLEHQGRTQFYRCARSYGIIEGSGRPISDSLAVGGWVRVR